MGTATERRASTPCSRSIEATAAGLEGAGYIANRQIATAVFLAHHLRKPILVEGPAGVGKTELAKTAAAWLGLPLVRMQCYEGLDESKALYEWKYGKQLLYTQILKDRLGAALGEEPRLDAALEKLHGFGDLFFSERFLEPRPLLRALREPDGAVLLVDEVDKSDQEFEAFLLEILSDYQVTRPGDRHGARRRAAARGAHLQQHPRPRRRAEAPLPPPAHRPAGRQARRPHPRRPRARHRGRAAPTGGALRPGAAHGST